MSPREDPARKRFLTRAWARSYVIAARSPLGSLFSLIRIRLILLVLIGVVPVLGLLLYTASEERSFLVEDAARENLQLVRFAAHQEDDLIGRIRQFVQIHARLCSKHMSDPAESSTWLAGLLPFNNRYANLGIIGRDGRIFSSALPVEDSLDLSDRDYFRLAMRTRDFVAGQYQIGRISGKGTVNFAYPVLDDAGSVMGVFYAALDLAWYNRNEFNRASIPPGATLTGVSSLGTILSRLPVSVASIGRNYPNSRVFDTVLARGSGVTYGRGFDGLPHVITFASMESRLRGQKLFLILSIPENEIFGAANHLRNRNILLLGIVTLVALSVAWVGGDFLFVSKLKALTRATERLAAGDFRARSGLSLRQGDFGKLVHSVDRMAEALEKNESERERYEAALRRSEERHRSIVETADEGICIVDRKCRILFANPKMAGMLGRTAEELSGRPFGHFLEGRSKNFCLEENGRSLWAQREIRLSRSNGGRLWALANAGPLLDEKGEPTGTLVMLTDIGRRKRAERKLRKYAGQLLALSHRLLRIQEEERAHLARELHDEIGQTLTRLIVSLDRSTNLPPEAAARMHEVRSGIKDLLDQVRNLSLELRPSMLDDLGLLPALVWLFERFRATTGARVAFEHEAIEARRFPSDMETSAYRLVQEALTNIARHSGVREATVRIWADEDILHLQVEDKGRGFDPSLRPAAGTSSGLNGLYERVRLLGGDLVIDSSPGAGTRVTAGLPLKTTVKRRGTNGEREHYPAGG